MQFIDDLHHGVRVQERSWREGVVKPYTSTVTYHVWPSARGSANQHACDNRNADLSHDNGTSASPTPTSTPIAEASLSSKVLRMTAITALTPLEVVRSGLPSAAAAIAGFVDAGRAGLSLATVSFPLFGGRSSRGATISAVPAEYSPCQGSLWRGEGTSQG